MCRSGCVPAAEALKCVSACQQRASFDWMKTTKRNTNAWYLQMWRPQIKMPTTHSFPSLLHYIPRFHISSSFCHISSRWCLVPITSLRLLLLRVPPRQHLSAAPPHPLSVCTLFSSVISTHPIPLYVHSFTGFSRVLVNHSTTQFLSVKASSSLLLVFFNLSNFKV